MTGGLGLEESKVGFLVPGVVEVFHSNASGGEFRRQGSHFRNRVTADGAAGPIGSDGFKAEPGRYQLYVSLACPGRIER